MSSSLSRHAGRRGPLVVAAALLLAGCSASTTDDAGDTGESGGASSEVTVETATGSVTVPVGDERIWALDEYAGLQLLALGITPVGVGEFFQDGASASLLEDAGSELATPGDVEAVAVARPTMVVGLGHPDHIDLADELGAVAPVVLPTFDSPWSDQLDVLAEVTGHTDQAAAIEAKVEEETEALAQDIADSDLAGATVSMVAEYADGTFWAFDQSTLAGQTVERLGFERPASQVNDDDSDFGFAPLSEELLPEQGGDVILSYTLRDSDQPSVLDNELFAPQVEAARFAADVENGVWAVTTPLSAWWMLQDLRALLLDGGEPADLDTVPERWAELTSGL